MLYVSMQRLNQPLRCFEFERDHVDDNVCTKAGNPRAEIAFRLFGSPVHKDLFDCLPRLMRSVGRSFTAADIDNLVSKLDKCGHKVGSDMPTPSNNDNPSHSFLLRLSTLHSTNSH
jgi:hypothetical protein